MNMQSLAPYYHAVGKIEDSIESINSIEADMIADKAATTIGVANRTESVDKMEGGKCDTSSGPNDKAERKSDAAEDTNEKNAEMDTKEKNAEKDTKEKNAEKDTKEKNAEKDTKEKNAEKDTNDEKKPEDDSTRKETVVTAKPLVRKSKSSGHGRLKKKRRVGK
jgi:hypothetical protein